MEGSLVLLVLALVSCVGATCPAGLSGPNCNINYCQSSKPCVNGTCYFNSQNGGYPLYYCACQEGFQGTNCDLAVNLCDLSPCQNGATCVSHINDYSCKCAPGYSGDQCEILVDHCLSQPCGAHGCCTSGVNSFSCKCSGYYSGSQCQIAPPCSSNPCKNGGLCANTVSGYTCTCPTAYVGTTCQQVAESANQRCIASSAASGYTCSCMPGYYGTGCTQGSAPSWSTLSSSQFAVVSASSANLAWADASQACKNAGGNLASIRSSSELTFILGLMNTAHATAAWIGLRTDASPEIWTDGSSLTYTHWASGQPSSTSCVEAVVQSSSLYWKTVPCTTVLGYVCRRSSTATTTATSKTVTTRATTTTAGPSCAAHSATTSIELTVVNIITGVPLDNFTIEVAASTTLTQKSLTSANSPAHCSSSTCASTCGLFEDTILHCLQCVCNTKALAYTVSMSNDGLVHLTLPPTGLFTFQTTVLNKIPIPSLVAASASPITGFYVVPFLSAPILSSPNPASDPTVTLYITLTWLDDGLASHKDFDSHLRTSYTLPSLSTTPLLCEVTYNNGCSQTINNVVNSAVFTTHNYRAGIPPYNTPGPETIKIKAQTGVFSHMVYGHASGSDFAGSNAMVSVIAFNALGSQLASMSLNVDINGAAGSAACSLRRFWHTFNIDLRSRPISVSVVNTLDCTPDISTPLSSLGTFPAFPNENGARTCSC